MDDVNPEAIMAQVEALVRRLPPAERRVVLRLLRALVDKAETMEADEAAAFVAETLPEILKLPLVWRHLHG